MILDRPENALISDADARRVAELDQQLRNLLVTEGGLRIVDACIPSLLSKHDIQRMGYFECFSGHLTGVVPTALSTSQPEFYLTPAACLPLYPIMKEFGELSELCITGVVGVFRYEEGLRSPGTRLWEFSVREMVFIGNERFVRNELESMERRSLALGKSIGLDLVSEVAADHFTGDDSRLNVLQRLQRANSFKRELRVGTAESSLAIASLNFHGTHFSRLYGWDQGGKVVSGCVGFGLRRWLHALSVSPPLGRDQGVNG